MLVALGVYGVAAAHDARTRAVPNWVWYLGLALVVLQGIGVVSLLNALAVFTLATIAWTRGAFGGADVKALGLLPLVLPGAWILALLVAYCLTIAGFVVGGREELPFLVPMFAGVIVAVAATAA